MIALAPYALATSGRRRGRLDIPGVITSTAGLALLVYGLTEAAAGQDGVSHWGDANVVAALAASAVLLVSFVFIEMRSTHAELPLHLLKSRRRSGAYIMMLLLGTAMFAVFFFLTIFTQTVWGYSPIRAGLAWVPFPLMIIVDQHAGGARAPDARRGAAAAARRAAAGRHRLHVAVAAAAWTARTGPTCCRRCSS